VPPELSWAGLAALGASGGLVPCESALVLLLSAIAMHRVGLGLMLLVSFSRPSVPRYSADRPHRHSMAFAKRRQAPKYFLALHHRSFTVSFRSQLASSRSFSLAHQGSALAHSHKRRMAT
jgi:hypothetical protein